MSVYLLTFPNVFDHIIFKNNIDKYKFNDRLVLTSHCSTFCEVKGNSFNKKFVNKLKQDFPRIKILLKQQYKNKSKYTTL